VSYAVVDVSSLAAYKYICHELLPAILTP
jgi:hypothetical protein